MHYFFFGKNKFQLFFSVRSEELESLGRFRSWLERSFSSTQPSNQSISASEGRVIAAAPHSNADLYSEISNSEYDSSTDEDDASFYHQLPFDPIVRTPVTHVAQNATEETLTQSFASASSEPATSSFQSEETGGFARVELLAFPVPLNNISSLVSTVETILNAALTAHLSERNIPAASLDQLHYLLSSMATTVVNLGRALSYDISKASTGHRLSPLSPSRAACLQVPSLLFFLPEASS